MQRRELLKYLASSPALAVPPYLRAAEATPDIAAGPFTADWNSLASYQVPEWYRNAKFGIWAHWGPQCEPEFGDWYGHFMYEEGHDTYKHHVATYGHPSAFGFKDVIPRWKAERWDPEGLVSLYKRAGARYFMALANHHDNFDLYASTHQAQWNSTRIGPKKDLIGGWSKAARNHGLRFGVSVHAAHAWQWYETAQRADKQGPLAGVPYDGNVTAADGKGTWWEGLDPQALYNQRHQLSKTKEQGGDPFDQWHWRSGASIPTQAYCENFFRRTLELIDKYEPDLVYYDDTVLPFYPFSDVGLRLAAHQYNRSVARHGAVEAVINGKILNEQQRHAMVWDIERGYSDRIEPLPWQTDTCLGDWHYDRRIYERKGYKSARTVVHTLIDIVSKNGNLMLNVPVRGDGTIDEQERAIVEEIGQWMAANGSAIYDTRPWAVFGEGPAMEQAALTGAGFNEGLGKAYTAADFRFTTKGETLYAFPMGWPPDGKLTIKSLRSGTPHRKQNIARVEIVASGRPLPFKQTSNGLEVTLPKDAPTLAYAVVLKIV